MNHKLGSQLRAAKRMLDKPVRPNKALQDADSQAMSLLRQRIYDVLDADDDQWLEMVRNYTAASNPVIRRLTVDVLIQCLLNKDQTIVARVKIWLAIIGTPAVAALNLKLLERRSLKWGVAVAEALGDISLTLPHHTRTLQYLKLDSAALRTRHPEVRHACVEAMFRIRNFSILPSN